MILFLEKKFTLIDNVSTFLNRLFMSSIQRIDVMNNQALIRVLGK